MEQGLWLTKFNKNLLNKFGSINLITYICHMIDLFEHYETLPQEVQDFIESKGEVVGYQECEKFIAELKQFGYTCTYGLDGCPIELRKLPNLETYKAFIEWKASDNVIRSEKNVWLTQCSQYGIRMNRKELYKYFKKEFGYNK